MVFATFCATGCRVARLRCPISPTVGTNRCICEVTAGGSTAQTLQKPVDRILGSAGLPSLPSPELRSRDGVLETVAERHCWSSDS